VGGGSSGGYSSSGGFGDDGKQKKKKKSREGFTICEWKQQRVCTRQRNNTLIRHRTCLCIVSWETYSKTNAIRKNILIYRYEIMSSILAFTTRSNTKSAETTRWRRTIDNDGVCGLGTTNVVACGKRDQRCLVRWFCRDSETRARVVWSGHRRRRTITAVTGQRINARSCLLLLLLYT